MSTPFDDLRLPLRPEAPDAGFAAQLRARLRQAAANAARTDTPTIATERRPTTMTGTITPYLCVADGRQALDWYRRWFGASASDVHDDGSRLAHAQLEFGGATFFLSDEYPELGVRAPGSIGEGSSASFVVEVADVDAFVARAVEGGAELQRPIQEAHGSRDGWLLDPFGHRWNIGTPDRPVEGRRRPAEPYYLTITSPDVERAAAFYGAVLDWQTTEPDPQYGGRHVTNTHQPMGLRPPHTGYDDTVPGEVQLWFTVRDFDDALDRVRTAGGTVLAVTSYDSGREARCQDDQQVPFRLSEPAPGYDT